MSAEPNATHAEVVGVLREWGKAIRGDWGGIDGRSCRDSLDRLANHLDFAHEHGEAGASLRRVRYDADVCQFGKGHWEHPWCGDYGCEGEVQS